jgi:hypothetical protein
MLTIFLALRQSGRGTEWHISDCVFALSSPEIVPAFVNDLETGRYVDTVDGLILSHG